MTPSRSHGGAAIATAGGTSCPCLADGPGEQAAGGEQGMKFHPVSKQTLHKFERLDCQTASPQPRRYFTTASVREWTWSFS